MSIADELREYAQRYKNSHDAWSGIGDELENIANRIEAEHEMATSEFWAKINAVPATEENMAEHGWVRLPVDADGEYIHIGDVMAYEDNTKPMQVVALVPPAVFMTEEGPRYADMCRHYRKPTVEDVMVEFAIDWESAPDGEDKTAVLKEYASKLQLRGEYACSAPANKTPARPRTRRVLVLDDATDGATGSCRCGACGCAIDPSDAFCRRCGAEMEG